MYNPGMFFRDIWFNRQQIIGKNALTVIFWTRWSIIENHFRFMVQRINTFFFFFLNLFQLFYGETTLKSTLDIHLWTNKVTGNKIYQNNVKNFKQEILQDRQLWEYRLK